MCWAISLQLANVRGSKDRLEQFASGEIDVGFLNHYYIAENRQYLGYDSTLATGPYNFGWPLTSPDRVEHFPYQNGLSINYWNTKYRRNTVKTHPGAGLVLPVDARPAALTWSDGVVARNRIQTFDATFGLEPTDAISLHRETPQGMTTLDVSVSNKLLSGRADLVADYLEGVGDRPVLPAVSPGEVKRVLPSAPPAEGEPVETILRNIVTGSCQKRLARSEGEEPPRPIIEFCYKSDELGEFVLDYDDVRSAADPDATLLAFFESSYAAAADLGSWDRAALECERGEPGRPRSL